MNVLAGALAGIKASVFSLAVANDDAPEGKQKSVSNTTTGNLVN